MQQQINLDDINDIKELKAMAYDQLLAREQADVNIQAINRRMQQVMEAPQNEEGDAEPKRKKNKKENSSIIGIFSKVMGE